MDSKNEQQQQIEAVGGAANKEVNIDINGDPDTTAVKSMSPDEGSRAGLTKDELMKYANEPFWIRLRNILFAAFWIVWVSILIAAVGYVINSPGCRMVSASATGVAAPANTTSTGWLFSDLVSQKYGGPSRISFKHTFILCTQVTKIMTRKKKKKKKKQHSENIY